MATPIKRREFEIWDQWHDFGEYCSYPGSKITAEQKHTLDMCDDLLYAFRLGMSLGLMLQSPKEDNMGEHDVIQPDPDQAGD